MELKHLPHWSGEEAPQPYHKKNCREYSGLTNESFQTIMTSSNERLDTEACNYISSCPWPLESVVVSFGCHKEIQSLLSYPQMNERNPLDYEQWTTQLFFALYDQPCCAIYSHLVWLFFFSWKYHKGTLKIDYTGNFSACTLAFH